MTGDGGTQVIDGGSAFMGDGGSGCIDRAIRRAHLRSIQLVKILRP